MKSKRQSGHVNHGDRLSRQAFTLIELMIVVGVILILSGISFKIISLVGRKTATARTLYVLEQTRNALEAYFVAVGTYPPPTDIPYVRPQSTAHFKYDPGNLENLGLAYYLKYWNDPRCKSWKKYADAVVGGVGIQYRIAPGYAGQQPTKYTNEVDSIRDGWNNDIHYQPNADLSGYSLWSDGGGLANNRIGLDKNE